MSDGSQEFRKFLDENGLKHGFIAKKLAVSATALSFWLNGHRTPTAEMRKRIAKLTDGRVGEQLWDA